MVTLKDGSIIAFAEGRVNNAGDFGDVDIVMKKSNDKGTSWSKLSTIVNYEKLQAGNPAPVVDLTDPKYPNGRIFLFYNTGNGHENDLRMGMGLREVWYITSTDGGVKWSRPTILLYKCTSPIKPIKTRHITLQNNGDPTQTHLVMPFNLSKGSIKEGFM